MSDEQKTRAELSDSELLQLTSDPKMTPEDWALLMPSERTRLQALTSPQTEDHSSAIDMIKSAFGTGVDAINGVAMGANESVFNLGKAVHSIPGIGNVTDFIAKALGPEGTDPAQAFAQAPAELEPTNTAQSVGKGVERIAEFVTPSRATWTAGNYLARPALNAWLNTSQKARPLLSKGLGAAEKALNITGDAAMSGAVGAAQGSDPGDAAKWSAGGAVSGEALSQLLRTLSTKTGAQIGPLLAAIAGMGAMESTFGGMTGVAGGALGGFSVARSIANRMIKKPGAVRRMRDAAEGAGRRSGQVGAGVSSSIYEPPMETSRGPRRRGQ